MTDADEGWDDLDDDFDDVDAAQADLEVSLSTARPLPYVMLGCREVAASSGQFHGN